MSHGNQLKNDGFKALGASVEHERRKAVEAVHDAGVELLAEIGDDPRRWAPHTERLDRALRNLDAAFRGE